MQLLNHPLSLVYQSKRAQTIEATVHGTCVPFVQGSTNNATCFLGPHRKYDPFTKSFMSLVPGQGHFGPDAIPGVSSSHIQTIALFPYTFTTQLQSHPTRGRTRAGAGANRSRSKRPEIAWSRSSWPSTPRWRTRRVKRLPHSSRLRSCARTSGATALSLPIAKRPPCV